MQEKTQTEDFCFRCAEGGHLMMCDVKTCSKVYHLQCLNLEAPPRGASLNFLRQLIFLLIWSDDLSLNRSVDLSMAPLWCVWSQKCNLLLHMPQFVLHFTRCWSQSADLPPTRSGLQRTLTRRLEILRQKARRAGGGRCRRGHSDPDQYTIVGSQGFLMSFKMFFSWMNNARFSCSCSSTWIHYNNATQC